VAAAQFRLPFYLNIDYPVIVGWVGVIGAAITEYYGVLE
jgi:hypothetical protein